NLNNLDDLTMRRACGTNQGIKPPTNFERRLTGHQAPNGFEHRLTGHQAPNGFEHKLTGHQALNFNAYVDSVKCQDNQQLNQLRQLLTTHMTLTRRQGFYSTTS
ncbi:hypothetical protein L195_g058530, partial [Trifolium pratense]